MALPDDNDLLVQLLAVKTAHISPSMVSALRRRQERGPRKGLPLARRLHEEGLISRERCAEWLVRGAPRKLLADMVRNEERFWKTSCSASFGAYRAVRKVAEGGRGVVFEGRLEDARSRAEAGADEGKAVAIKVLAERHSFDMAEMERFLRETDLQAELRHPGIIPVLTSGWAGSIPYYVMEFVRGTLWGTAWEMMQAPVWNVAVLLSVLDVLQYLHERSVVHADVKPENVLLTTEGGVFLTDFGVAVRIGDSLPKGTAIGTPVYMSPEQAQGGVPLDARTDVYSAGAALYEALTRHQPYEAATKVEVIDALLEGAPPRPREVNPEIPEPLERIVLKAMDRNLRRRYPSAFEMAEDLRRWRSGQEVQAKPRRFWQGVW